MILYYALGGGLGHITRSLAVLRSMNGCSREVRLLVSSDLAPLAAPLCPCPVDCVPREIMSSRAEYYRYLSEHLRTYRIRTILLDSFPFGIVGEWAALAPEIPRILIARSLRWPEYVSHTGSVGGPWPSKALVIEPPDPEYLTQLKRADLEFLDAPITLSLHRPPAAEFLLRPQGDISSQWVVVHSGSGEERAALLRFTKELMQEKGDLHEPAAIFPEQGIYPAEPILARFSHVVSAAGYNMAACALLNSGRSRHYLYPLKRRFDDQHQRASRLSEGTWLKSRQQGARVAAGWVMRNVFNGSLPGCGRSGT